MEFKFTTQNSPSFCIDWSIEFLSSYDLLFSFFFFGTLPHTRFGKLLFGQKSLCGVSKYEGAKGTAVNRESGPLDVWFWAAENANAMVHGFLWCGPHAYVSRFSRSFYSLTNSTKYHTQRRQKTPWTNETATLQQRLIVSGSWQRYKYSYARFTKIVCTA